MTGGARERRISIKIFCDASLHLEMYCFDDTLERFNSDVEPPHHSERANNDNNVSEAAFYNDGNVVEISPVLRASHLFAQEGVARRFQEPPEVMPCSLRGVL